MQAWNLFIAVNTVQDHVYPAHKNTMALGDHCEENRSFT